MEDRCLKRVKEASGLSVFLMEELGDARLRCNQLKDYLDEANQLIEKSEQRDHFFEVAGHLLHGIPDTLMRMDKALAAAAMAVAKWDYEEIKEDLAPEKADQLEDALKDVRVRRVKRKSSEPEASMKTHEAAEQLKQIAVSIERTGQVDTEPLARLIASLEGESVRTASSNEEVALVLRRLAADLSNPDRRPSRLMLASVLRRVLGDTIEVGSETLKRADLEPEPEAHYNMAMGFEFIRDAARLAFLRGSKGLQMRQAFDQLASIVSEIGLMCDSIGASDVAGLAIRMSKAVRLARRHLKPDMLESMVLASDEKESRFEQGKPADPTEEMSEEDAKDWKANTEKYKDKFKSASSSELREMEDLLEKKGYNPKDAKKLVKEGMGPYELEERLKEKGGLERTHRLKKLASDEKESRFEQGKPADPTENMSEDDAEQWKENTDKYEDKFKAAGTRAKDLVPGTRPKKYSGDEESTASEDPWKA